MGSIGYERKPDIALLDSLVAEHGMVIASEIVDNCEPLMQNATEAFVHHAAVRRGDKISAFITLVERAPNMYWVKVMNETEGPAYCNCPRHIFDLLTPVTVDEADQHWWRARVLDWHENGGFSRLALRATDYSDEQMSDAYWGALNRVAEEQLWPAAQPILDDLGNRESALLVAMMLVTDIIAGQTCPDCRAREVALVENTMPQFIKQTLEAAKGRQQTEHRPNDNDNVLRFPRKPPNGNKH
jgi:hypothetical protein